MGFYIGLTGNLGSGKSTVAKAFEAKGIEVISADTIARELTQVDTPAYKEIIQHFGATILDDKGELDRRKLREKIFSYPEEKIWLENLLHPPIREALQARLTATHSPYAIAEIPLLTQKALYPYLNRVLCVIAPQKVSLSRVQSRDHCTLEQALAILNAQPSLMERIRLADDLIFNDKDHEHIRQQVEMLHTQYIKACMD